MSVIGMLQQLSLNHPQCPSDNDGTEATEITANEHLNALRRVTLLARRYSRIEWFPRLSPTEL